MKVELWSDVSCPFCWIGKRNFETALASFAHRPDVDVVWRSFELSPDMPRDPPLDMHDLIAAKTGSSRDEAREMNGRVSAMAAEAGLDYDLDRARPTNTFDAHRVTQLGIARGVGDAVAERLFRAFFEEGEHLGDHATLARLAGEAGLDAGEVADALAGGGYADAVRADSAEALRLGIRAVPAFVIDRAFLIPGAVPPDAMLGALQRAWTEGAGDGR
jgi:predicted DsbA family dithiol-disulfide isomerase